MPWTDTARAKYARAFKRYASDVTDEEWSLIEGFLPPRRRPGRPRTTDLREVVNALLCGLNAGPEIVIFEHAPDDRFGRLDRQLGLTCIYGQTENSFALPEQLLSCRALRPSHDADGASMLATLNAALMARDAEVTFGELVRRAVLSQIGCGDLGQQSVALACGVSERSLRRHLRSEGRSFRHEIERLRLAYAREMLTRSHVPLAEIARRLGYTDQSAFTRAFRRAAGTAPIQLRH